MIILYYAIPQRVCYDGGEPVEPVENEPVENEPVEPVENEPVEPEPDIIATLQSQLSEKDSLISEMASRYNALLIETELNAAVKAASAHPLITEILAGKTSVVDGKVIVTLDEYQVSPAEAMKLMEAKEKYQPLFRNWVAGIGGSGNVDVPRKVRVQNLSPEQYRRIRKENPKELGLK